MTAAAAPPRAVERPAQAVEMAEIHLAACRYRRQGLVCSRCREAEQALGRTQP